MKTSNFYIDLAKKEGCIREAMKKYEDVLLSKDEQKRLEHVLDIDVAFVKMAKEITNAKEVCGVYGSVISGAGWLAMRFDECAFICSLNPYNAVMEHIMDNLTQIDIIHGTRLYYEIFPKLAAPNKPRKLSKKETKEVYKEDRKIIEILKSKLQKRVKIKASSGYLPKQYYIKEKNWLGKVLKEWVVELKRISPSLVLVLIKSVYKTIGKYAFYPYD